MMIRLVNGVDDDDDDDDEDVATTVVEFLLPSPWSLLDNVKCPLDSTSL